MIKSMTVSSAQIERMFPCDNDDGRDVKASEVATNTAAVELGCSPADVVWRLPDVFAVRYGSNYVGTASYKDQQVRIFGTEGEWKEGDDK